MASRANRWLREISWDPSGGGQLAELGEERMLERLINLADRAGDIVVPPGDDAGGWVPRGRQSLISTDSMVEGVHFRREFQTPYQVGVKAWAQAVSDLAAMGAMPEVGVIAAVLPADTRVAVVEAIQLGLVDRASEDGAVLLGGDLSAGPALSLSVTVVGGTGAEDPVRIGGGRAGDLLVVTGELGGASGALQLLRAGGVEVPESLMGRLIAPPSRLAEGDRLRRNGVSAMTDVSDGLVLDAGRLARASGVQVEIWADQLPRPVGFRELLGDAALGLALSGGEDYELLASVAPEKLEALLGSWPVELAPLSLVGALVAGEGTRVLTSRGGREIPLDREGGYQHFQAM
ncbi:MAG: thiamine-phosphate kinase [Candidatus Dormibacteraeota bacterium]|nr:thiamine-phosphate kinase [Candidatus Dormibacteraeota bacterium]